MKEITLALVKDWIPQRDPHTYKNKLGRVLCVGGNASMGGAMILMSSAALHTGAGLVIAASHPSNVHALHARSPEIMFTNMYDTEALIKQVQAADVVAIGPGLGLDQDSQKVFSTVISHLREDQKVIIDADGITLYTQLKPQIDAHVFFTPHLGEWQRLSGLSPQEEDPSKNQDAQRALGATIILKKARTQVYTNKQVWQNTCGNPSMATGGMGDTLTGILTGCLAQFSDVEQAVLSGVFIHSYIGDQLGRNHYVSLPTSIIQAIPQTMHVLATQEKE